MKVSIKRNCITGLRTVTLAAAFCCGLVGCAHYTTASQPMANGAVMQSAGFISQADYVKLHEITDRTRRDGTISDTDLGY